MKNPYIIAGVIIIALIGIYAVSHWSTDERTAREVALTCTTDMATEYHIHPVLRIVINGEQILIPENVGISRGCMMSLHTHTPDGIIHVESPVQRDFTLGDFFAVWGQTFNEGQIFEHEANEQNVITMTVNGEAVDTFEDTILRDDDQILIVYGPVVQ